MPNATDNPNPWRVACPDLDDRTFHACFFGQGSLSFGLGSKTERKTRCGRWSKMAWNEVGGRGGWGATRRCHGRPKSTSNMQHDAPLVSSGSCDAQTIPLRAVTGPRSPAATTACGITKCVVWITSDIRMSNPRQEAVAGEHGRERDELRGCSHRTAQQKLAQKPSAL